MTYHPSGSSAATSDEQRIESESTSSCSFASHALVSEYSHNTHALVYNIAVVNEMFMLCTEMKIQ